MDANVLERYKGGMARKACFVGKRNRGSTLSVESAPKAHGYGKELRDAFLRVKGKRGLDASAEVRRRRPVVRATSGGKSVSPENPAGLGMDHGTVRAKRTKVLRASFHSEELTAIRESLAA